MSDAKLKYFDLLEAVIGRMASNSFVIKGWSVTLITALLGFAVKDNSAKTAYVAVVPCLSFWILDAYYLSLETQFRNIFKQAVIDENVTFRMIPKDGETISWWSVLRSPSIAVLHLPLLIVVLLVAIYGVKV